MRNLSSAILALLAAGCAHLAPPGPAPQASAHVDHIILGVSDLSRAMPEIERLTGVRPVLGGAHTGKGTQNALMSLGPRTYLEIYAPNPAEPMRSAEIEELRELARPTPLGWAVSTGNLSGMKNALAAHGFALSPEEPGSRRKPDGSVLNWITFGFADLEDMLAPFFIIWRDPDKHPARTSPGGCTLKSLEIEEPKAERLHLAVEALGLPVRVRNSAYSRMRLRMKCPKGEVSFQ